MLTGVGILGFIRYIKENWVSILLCIIAGFALFPILFTAITILYIQNINTRLIVYSISWIVIAYNFVINFLKDALIREDSKLKRFDGKVKYYLSAGTFFATNAVVFLKFTEGTKTKITPWFVFMILFSIVISSFFMIGIIFLVNWLARNWFKKKKKMITIENIYLINLNNKK